VRSNIFSKVQEEKEDVLELQTILTQVHGHRVEDNQIVIYGVRGAVKKDLVIEFYNLEMDYFFNLFHIIDELEEAGKGLLIRKVTTYSSDGEPDGFTLFVQKLEKGSLLEVPVPDEEASVFARNAR